MTTPTPEITVSLNGPQRAIFARCTPCSHVWVVIYLPMEMRRASRAMSRSYCPSCGSHGPDHTLAEPTDIEAWRAGAHDKGMRK